MTCRNHVVANFIRDCATRPVEERYTLINSVPFTGSSIPDPNIIFDAEDAVVLAGSMENFSNDSINVIFFSKTTAPTITYELIHH